LCFALWIIALETRYWVISCWLGIILIVLVFRLIQIQQRSKKAFQEFLASVKEEDFISLSTIDESDGELRKAYQVIHEKFR
jgi:predicted membrane protein